MKKHIVSVLGFLIFSLLYSCHLLNYDEIYDAQSSKNQRYFLTFQIGEYNYNNEEIKYDSVQMLQENSDYEFSTVLTDDSHFFYQYYMDSADSISVYYNKYYIDHLGNSPVKNCTLTIFYREDKKHLIMHEDLTHVDYKDTDYKYEQLEKANDFDTDNYGFHDGVLLSLELRDTTFNNFCLNNFAYFFQSESEFNPIEYFDVAFSVNATYASGNFDILLKESSCGFWITHHLKNGKFTFEIE